MIPAQLINLETWVVALCSGNYLQSRGYLRSWRSQVPKPFMQAWTALGVAAQIFYVGDLSILESQSDLTGLGVAELLGIDMVGTLPQPVLVQKPMGDNSRSGNCTNVQCLNDRARYSFNQIADQITRQIITPQKIVLG